VEWTQPAFYQPPTGFRATVERRPLSELPSYELRGYRLHWEARDHDGTLLASGASELPTIGAPALVEGEWPATSSREIRLELRVERPTGFVAAERTERWWESRSGGLSPQEAKKKGLSAP
jgi:hypothetical protein